MSRHRSGKQWEALARRHAARILEFETQRIALERQVADRDRELALWRQETRLAMESEAHPHARSVAAMMLSRVSTRLAIGEG